MRTLGLILLWLLAASPAALAEPRLSVFAGQMTDNEWGDLFVRWEEFDTRDARTVGAGVQWERPIGPIGHIGIEASVLQWSGEQTHAEFTLPIFVRTPRPPQRWIPSAAYGLGLSYATSPSRTEISRTGTSARLLAHWFIEAEFGNEASRYRPFVRLHHRSDAGGTFDADTGSNAILFGVRLGPNR